MTIQVTGKNVDAGEAFKSYASSKISAAIGKYTGAEIAGHVRLEKERSVFRTGVVIRLKSGLMLEATGEGGDAYASADSAIEHLEKRLRRHKRRITNHHGGHAASPRETLVPDFTVEVGDDEAGEASSPEANAPAIIAESERSLKEMSVGEAVMQLDLIEKTFLLFRNAAHGGLNVVYRRADGHVGWIDPALGAGGGEKARKTAAE